MNVHVVIDDVEVAERAVAGGATVVQVRLKDAGTAARAAMGRRLRHLPAMLVINDDVEAALQIMRSRQRPSNAPPPLLAEAPGNCGEPPSIC